MFWNVLSPEAPIPISQMQGVPLLSSAPGSPTLPCSADPGHWWPLESGAGTGTPPGSSLCPGRPPRAPPEAPALPGSAGHRKEAQQPLCPADHPGVKPRTPCACFCPPPGCCRVLLRTALWPRVALPVAAAMEVSLGRPDMQLRIQALPPCHCLLPPQRRPSGLGSAHFPAIWTGSRAQNSAQHTQVRPRQEHQAEWRKARDPNARPRLSLRWETRMLAQRSPRRTTDAGRQLLADKGPKSREQSLLQKHNKETNNPQNVGDSREEATHRSADPQPQ